MPGTQRIPIQCVPPSLSPSFPLLLPPLPLPPKVVLADASIQSKCKCCMQACVMVGPLVQERMHAHEQLPQTTQSCKQASGAQSAWQGLRRGSNKTHIHVHCIGGHSSFTLAASLVAGCSRHLETFHRETANRQGAKSGKIHGKNGAGIHASPFRAAGPGLDWHTYLAYTSQVAQQVGILQSSRGLQLGP